MTAEPRSSVELPTRKATKSLARALAASVAPGDLIILSGSLGAGKTFLVRALARALGLPESVRVVSPTFPLLRELPTKPPLAHADLYRLVSLEDAHELGLEELREGGALLIVEWGDSHRAALGGDALEICIQLAPRRAILAGDGPRSRALSAEVMQRLGEAGHPWQPLPEDRDSSR